MLALVAGSAQATFTNTSAYSGGSVSAGVNGTSFGYSTLWNGSTVLTGPGLNTGHMDVTPDVGVNGSLANAQNLVSLQSTYITSSALTSITANHPDGDVTYAHAHTDVWFHLSAANEVTLTGIFNEASFLLQDGLANNIFSVTAGVNGAIVPQVFNLAAGDYSVWSDSYLSAVDGDTFLAGSYSWTLREKVPEPISMVMLGCLGAGMAAARKLRRKVA